ncbi:MAG: hypothetical protein CVU42_07630 [Chloroflexi bacterium HGW-Chloroflexi-4]|jgi:hypothetical protein|nr:MAG: hypothetical protein CVU42_07630 [Chloroflexi bacterium HGW-Chloroflexi-4]
MKKLIITFLFLASLLTACGINPSFVTDVEKINNAAAEIVKFDLPEGFLPELSVNFKEYTMVSYKSGNGGTHLYFIQVNNPIESEILSQQVEVFVTNTVSPENRTKVLESRPVVVRGKETTLVLSQGLNGNGKTYRQAMVAFEGLGGPAMLIFSTPTDVWNLDTLNTLIESIE